MKIVWIFHTFPINTKEKYFPALFNLKNKAVLQKRGVETEGKIISSKSVLDIHTKNGEMVILLFYFGREGIWLSMEVGT